MPYIDQTKDKEKKLAPTQGVAGTPMTVTGGIPAVGGPSAGAGQAQGSGKFVNFDRIFAANKGDAQNMAQGVADDVGGKASDARRSIDNSALGFNQQVRAGTPGAYGSETVVANPTGDQSATKDTKNGLTGTPQKETNYISRDEAAARAAQGYSGPEDYLQTQGYQDTAKKVQDANDNLNLTKDAYGLQTYLQNQQRAAGNGGNYTNGMSVWDAALTGAAGADTFGALRKKYAGLDTQLAGSVANAAQNVTDAKANSADAQAQYGSDVGAFDKKTSDQVAQDEAVAKEKGAGPGNPIYDAWVAAGRPPDYEAFELNYARDHAEDMF